MSTILSSCNLIWLMIEENLETFDVFWYVISIRYFYMFDVNIHGFLGRDFDALSLMSRSCILGMRCLCTILVSHPIYVIIDMLFLFCNIYMSCSSTASTNSLILYFISRASSQALSLSLLKFFNLDLIVRYHFVYFPQFVHDPWSFASNIAFYLLEHYLDWFGILQPYLLLSWFWHSSFHTPYL